jgi:hypothetical protein
MAAYKPSDRQHRKNGCMFPTLDPFSSTSDFTVLSVTCPNMQTAAALVSWICMFGDLERCSMSAQFDDETPCFIGV